MATRFTFDDNRICLSAQGATLRAGFPKEAKNHPVYGVLDDSKLQTLLKKGKVWTGKARQCMQTMQAGRPMASSLLFGLVEEAQSIKLNLSPEVRGFFSNLHPASVHYETGAFDGEIVAMQASTVVPVDCGLQHKVLQAFLKHMRARPRNFVSTPRKQYFWKFGLSVSVSSKS